MNWFARLLLVGVFSCLSVTALAQDDEEIFDEDPDEATLDPTPSSTMDTEDSSGESNSSPSSSVGTSPGDTGASTTNARPTSRYEESEDEVIKGFEFGLNLAGSKSVYVARHSYSPDAAETRGWTWESGQASKVAFQPGWSFGRFGIYLLLGFNYDKIHEEAVTKDHQMSDYGNPGYGATYIDGWWEKAVIDIGIFTFDIGIDFRIYLLEQLRARSPNLYLDINLGWRGAAAKAEMDWKFGGDIDVLGDVNGSGGDPNSSDRADQEYENTTVWNEAAEDYVDAAVERYDGLWWNIGLGGEYVFTGGFGVATEVGLHFFVNTKWTDQSPFGSDYEAEVGAVDWEHLGVKWSGTAFEMGLYYSLALRYHF